MKVVLGVTEVAAMKREMVYLPSSKLDRSGKGLRLDLLPCSCCVLSEFLEDIEECLDDNDDVS